MTEFHRDIPREPSVLDTAMRIDDPAHLECLELKMVEYRERSARLSEQVAYMHPDEILRRHSPEIFRELILDYVIKTATARDTTTDPILITEVALMVSEATGFDVSRSVTIPFRFNQNNSIYEPDMERLYAETTPADVAFSDAYGVIKVYANNERLGVRGGTGLPQPPTDA